MGQLFYNIDKKTKLIYTKCRGRLTLEDLIEHSMRVTCDPQFQQGMNGISDIREAEIENSFQMLFRFYNHIKKYGPIGGKINWAIIVGAKKPDSAKLFQTLASDGNSFIELFGNKDEAEKWISKRNAG